MAQFNGTPKNGYGKPEGYPMRIFEEGDCYKSIVKILIEAAVLLKDSWIKAQSEGMPKLMVIEKGEPSGLGGKVIFQKLSQSCNLLFNPS